MASAWLAACGSLPANIARTPTAALAPDPTSPLVKITRASLPSEDTTACA